MKGNNKSLKLLIILFVSVFVLSNLTSTLSLSADSPKRNRVIVSMGDSYSSGEGVAPFWDDYEKFMKTQKDDRTIEEKINDPNWLAHRSIWAWSGQLALPETGIINLTKHNENPNWYFVASSGAETKHIIKESQPKPISKGNHKTTDDTAYKLPLQINILKEMKSMRITPDYVTLTIGGNDAGFEKIIETAIAAKATNLPGLVEHKINKVWDEFKKPGGIRENLKSVYKEISRISGTKTCILVGGYPKLFSPKDCGQFIREKDAEYINDNVHKFNIEIQKLVKECHDEDKMNIKFVCVEEAFETHGAYSKTAFINPILDPQSEDLKDKGLGSAYSIHPNLLGIQAYRDCFQRAIDDEEHLDHDWIKSLITTPTPTTETTAPSTTTLAPLTDDQCLTAIKNYIFEELGYDEYKGEAPWYLELDAKSNSSTAVVHFRAYTGSHNFFYIDRISGETHEKAYPPHLTIDVDEPIDGATFNARDYLNISISTPAAKPVVKVTDAVNKTFKADYGVKYKYQIPKITISGKNTDEINRKIKKDNPERFSNPKYDSDIEGGICDVTYTYNHNDKIISILIRYSNQSGVASPVGYKVYNISVSTGKFISDKEMLELYGTTETAFFSTVKSIYEKIEMKDDDYDFPYDKTETLKRVSFEYIDPYLGQNNHLCFVGVIWGIGGGQYEGLDLPFDTETKKCIDPVWEKYFTNQ